MEPAGHASGGDEAVGKHRDREADGDQAVGGAGCGPDSLSLGQNDSDGVARRCRTILSYYETHVDAFMTNMRVWLADGRVKAREDVR